MNLSKEKIKELEEFSFNIRKHIIKTCVTNGDGHAGSSLSCTDIVATLYMDILNLNLKDDKDPNRDYFILSAGHKCLALYGALIEKGFESPEILKTYNKMDSLTPGHPYKTLLKGIDFNTGSLGHGLSLGCGVAMGLKKMKKTNKIYVLMGDGEQGEGSIWESASIASHHELDNIVAIIDKNTLQINGTISEIQNTNSLKKRYEAFGWSVRRMDGHNIEEIHNVLSAAPFEKGKPSLIIANTIKGKGLSFAENNIDYHHWNPGSVESELALKELRDMEVMYNV